MTHEKILDIFFLLDYKYHNLPHSFLMKTSRMSHWKERIGNEGLAFLEVKFLLLNFIN